MAAAVRQRRRHQRTKDIAPPVEITQVPPPRDVQVVQPKGVPRPETTATDDRISKMAETDFGFVGLCRTLTTTTRGAQK